MSAVAPRRWILPAVLVGVGYASVGVLFALPPTNVLVWRRAAWVVCLIAFLAHIAYERLHFRNPTRLTALHVALAVALGAFGLAAAANIHSLWTGTGNQERLLLALAIWPIITAVPAYLVALLIGAVLGRFSGRN